jgi:hypothetical protein
MAGEFAHRGELAGIAISARAASTEDWAPLGVYVPREPTTPMSISVPPELLENCSSLAALLEVRLEWYSDHEIDYAGLFAPDSAAAPPYSLNLSRALAKDGADVQSMLQDADGQFVQVSPGEALALEFADSSDVEGKRSYILESVGHYVTLGDEITPLTTRLRESSPNPFNPSTTIRFDLDREQPVVLAIYNVRGERVRLLAEGMLAAGPHAIRWDGLDDVGHQVASGVYLCTLRAAESTQTQNLVLTM